MRTGSYVAVGHETVTVGRVKSAEGEHALVDIVDENWRIIESTVRLKELTFIDPERYETGLLRRGLKIGDNFFLKYRILRGEKFVERSCYTPIGDVLKHSINDYLAWQGLEMMLKWDNKKPVVRDDLRGLDLRVELSSMELEAGSEAVIAAFCIKDGVFFDIDRDTSRVGSYTSLSSTLQNYAKDRIGAAGSFKVPVIKGVFVSSMYFGIRGHIFTLEYFKGRKYYPPTPKGLMAHCGDIGLNFLRWAWDTATFKNY